MSLVKNRPGAVFHFIHTVLSHVYHFGHFFLVFFFYCLSLRSVFPEQLRHSEKKKTFLRVFKVDNPTVDRFWAVLPFKRVHFCNTEQLRYTMNINIYFIQSHYHFRQWGELLSQFLSSLSLLQTVGVILTKILFQIIKCKISKLRNHKSCFLQHGVAHHAAPWNWKSQLLFCYSHIISNYKM